MRWLSALPLSTQNHLLYKIIYRESMFQSVIPANNPSNKTICCIRSRAIPVTVLSHVVFASLPHTFVQTRDFSKLPEKIRWGLWTTSHCKTKDGILGLVTSTPNRMCFYLYQQQALPGFEIWRGTKDSNSKRDGRDYYANFRQEEEIRNMLTLKESIQSFLARTIHQLDLAHPNIFLCRRKQ